MLVLSYMETKCWLFESKRGTLGFTDELSLRHSDSQSGVI